MLVTLDFVSRHNIRIVLLLFEFYSHIAVPQSTVSPGYRKLEIPTPEHRECAHPYKPLSSRVALDIRVAVVLLTHFRASHLSFTSSQTCLPHFLNTLRTNPSFARLFGLDGCLVDQVLHEEHVIEVYLYKR